MGEVKNSRVLGSQEINLSTADKEILSRIDQLEDRFRRNNLRFEGILEDSSEKW